MAIKLYNNTNREKPYVVFTKLYKEIIEGKAKYVGVQPNFVSNSCTRIQGHAFRNKVFRVTFNDGELVQGLGLNCFVARFVDKVQSGGRLEESHLQKCFPWVHAYELRKVVFEVDVYVFDEKGIPEDKVEEVEEEEEEEEITPAEIENNPEVVEEVVETVEAPEVIEAAEVTEEVTPTKKPRLRRTKA